MCTSGPCGIGPKIYIKPYISHPSQYYSNQSGLNFKLLMEPNCENPFLKVITYFKRCKSISFVGLRIVKQHITLLDSFSIVPKLASNEKPHSLGGL
jgi:hypothetical protein